MSGNVLYACCQWGILLLLARWETTRAVGEFSLALAIATPVMLFGGLQLRGIQATDALDTFGFRDYLALRLAALSLSLFGILIGTYGAGYPTHTTLVILAVGVAKAIEAISDIYFGLLQKHERLDYVSRSLAAKGCLSLVAVSGVLALGGGVLAASLALAVAWGVVLMRVDMRAPQRVAAAIAGEIDLRSVGRLLRLALPLGLVSALLAVQANAPRYFVEKHRGTAELGVFAVVSSLVATGSIFVTALCQSASPGLARCFAAADLVAFRRSLLRYAAAGLAVGVLGVLGSLAFGKLALRLLFGLAYAQYGDLLIWVMCAAVFGYPASVFGYGMTAARRFGAQLPLVAATTTTALVASHWLVPRYGLKGAAWAGGAAFAVQALAAGPIALWPRSSGPVSRVRLAGHMR